MQCEQRAGMPLVYLFVFKSHLHLCRKFQQPQVIGHRGTFFSNLQAQFFLFESVLFYKVLVSQRYFYCVKVLALYVFNEGHLHHFLVVGSAYVSRHCRQASQRSRSPATLACNYLVHAVACASQRYGLHYAYFANRIGQFLQGFVVEFTAWLRGIGLYAFYGHFAY